MRIWLLCFLLGFGIVTYGQQKSKLAIEYYNSGEFEKAAQLFEELYRESNGNKSYFNYYVQSLLDLELYDEVNTIISDELKKNPNDVSLYVTLGNLYERQGNVPQANKEYQRAIQNLGSDLTHISNLATTFTNLAKYEMAIETYLKGEKASNVKNLYVYNLADLYRRVGDTKNMIKYYLMQVQKDQNSMNVQMSLQRYLQDSDYPELQKQLYELVQTNVDVPYYGELLQWTFMQNKEYDKALRQAKALDRQFSENGHRVFKMAEIAVKDEKYETAIDAFQYIIDEHGQNSTFYIEARRGLLNTRKVRVTQNYNYSQEDLQALKNEYNVFLNELGRNTQTSQIMYDFAQFTALYLNELDTAIIILEDVRQFGGISPDEIAKIKLSLGDYYLMDADRWEASLLYSQVDKDFKEGILGEQARYRNARLSYFSGDFEWAQEQFKILKGATSRLISNDAIDMSVFILDNLGLDTTEQTLNMYAQAELLAFQNKYDQAFSKLDSIMIVFPEHSLEDDVHYVKANLYKKLRNYDAAIAEYTIIIDKFKDDIRADNALFELAELYEYLQKPDMAKPLYEKLFIDYSDSTFAVEARKKYRILRGDEI
ncbi:MAG: tetratricopeptide repeat protein [Saprospiraceae bacterium]